MKIQSINQKKKGNKNEVVAAKFLENWTGFKFVRTPSSGGRHLKNELFAGDVVCVKGKFPFVVETKHLKTIQLMHELRSNSKVLTIMTQAKRDADRVGKLPMLMLRVNGMEEGRYMVYLEYSIPGLNPSAWWRDGVNRLYGYWSDHLAGMKFSTFKNFVLQQK